MKKLLAMVLALVMTLSLAVSANAAFKDADKVSADYSEAVAVLNGMGVFKGYEDGSFQPQGNITRAEVAAIVYRVYTADVKDAKASMYATYNKFSDMTGAGWAQGYIGYCANAALVKGYPNGTFQPSGKVTGYEVLAMILRAIGYDQNNEFTGADWALHVAQTAQQAHVLDNVKGVDLNAPATRELVAELLFRAIAKAPMVTYTAAFGYQTVSFNGDKNSNKTFSENDTLGYKSFKLKSEASDDEFGRLTTEWTYDVGDKKTVVDVEPLATYTEAAKNCDIYADSGLKKDKVLDVYTNSDTKDGTYTIADNKNDSKQADQGRLTLVYKDRIVNIDTYLTEVTKFVDAKTDSKGHVDSAYAIVGTVYGYPKDAAKIDTKFETEDEFAKYDMVLVTIADGDIQSMVKAESKTAVLTKVAGSSKNIDTIQDVKGLDKADATVNCTATYAPIVGSKVQMTLGKTYNFYFDTYGNVIGADNLARNYAVLDTLYIEGVKGVDTAYGDLYFFDGDSKTDSTIEKVNGYTVKDNAIKNSSSKNSDFYKTVYAYTVNGDGEYTLSDSKFDKASTASFRSGDKYVTIDAGKKSADRLQLSKDSQILLQTAKSPKGTFQAVTGYADLKSFEGTDVQYLIDESTGYVDMIYVYASEVSSRTVFIYDTTAYESNWNDGKPYATFKAYELVDKELKDVEVEIYYKDESDDVSVSDGKNSIDEVGLYELTVSTDNVYTVVDKYEAKTIKQLASDRIKTTDNRWFDLDNALIAQYEGTSTKGDVDLTWKTSDLTKDSYIFVQYDDSKNTDTFDALVVYDMYINAGVTVNDKATEDAEYEGKQFSDVTVALEEYEQIASVKMDGKTLDESKYTVTYFDKDGKEIEDGLNAKGTKVASAVISSKETVTGKVDIATKVQDAYNEYKLENGTYNFDGKNQSVEVADNTITVKTNGETVTVANLKALLKEKALKSNFQTFEIYNTNEAEVATGNVANDMVVKVTAWNTKNENTPVKYTITVDAEPIV